MLTRLRDTQLYSPGSTSPPRVLAGAGPPPKCGHFWIFENRPFQVHIEKVLMWPAIRLAGAGSGAGRVVNCADQAQGCTGVWAVTAHSTGLLLVMGSLAEDFSSCLECIPLVATHSTQWGELTKAWVMPANSSWQSSSPAPPSTSGRFCCGRGTKCFPQSSVDSKQTSTPLPLQLLGLGLDSAFLPSTAL